MSSSPTLHIKNMVCNRCKMVVKQLFKRHGLPVVSVELGEVLFAHPPRPEQLAAIERELIGLGFEIIGDKRARLVSSIQTAIITYLADPALMARQKLSEYLADQLHINYSTLSQTFSLDRGITIERYAILQKIERVKELLVYDELTIAEIAYRLNYSSAAHLSAQFKNVTGMSPRTFKQMGAARRKALDEV